MHKVMIVDDEKWIRRGLIQSIDWERFGLELAGEAGDGEEAYEMALAVKPELLFLDMRMPGLDGKQLLGLLKHALPQTVTIVVSGYSDFEYTKEAIRQKAYDYLLKPVKREELSAVLDKAVRELERRSQAQRTGHAGAEEWLSRCLLHSGDSVQPSGKVDECMPPEDWQAGGYAVAVCRPDVFLDTWEEARAVKPLLLEQLERHRPFLLGGSFLCTATSSPGDPRETVIAFCASRLGQPDLNQLYQVMQAATRRAGDASYSFGFSRIKRDPLFLGEAYREARQALRSRSLSASACVLFFGESPSTLSVTYPLERENALWLALQAGNGDAASVEFDRWFEASAKSAYTVEQLQHNSVVLVHAMNKQLQTKGSLLEEVCGRKLSVLTEMILYRNDTASVRRFFEEELLPAVLSHHRRSSEKQSETIVAELRKLIETHYDQPLSLHQIASSRYMNPDYLSRLFKKATGTNFVDYLTDVRIRNAKDLMRMSNCKNYEIAQKVGYEDYRYFSQIFKKKVGMTIGEYRSRIDAAIPLGGEPPYDQTLHT
ncbi:response regulator [Paenibacillus silviterrae]|uniref:response regulator n=1 Tax=Paenibacillus silviterrae TaxID=3242194 RepID=UPI0025430534|nr:response regulator [Paenibacillus chinjuensis]